MWKRISGDQQWDLTDYIIYLHWIRMGPLGTLEQYDINSHNILNIQITFPSQTFLMLREMSLVLNIFWMSLGWNLNMFSKDAFRKNVKKKTRKDVEKTTRKHVFLKLSRKCQENVWVLCRRIFWEIRDWIVENILRITLISHKIGTYEGREMEYVDNVENSNMSWGPMRRGCYEN